MVKIFKEIKVAIESINRDLDIIFVKKKEDIIEKDLIVIIKIKNSH